MNGTSVVVSSLHGWAQARPLRGRVVAAGPELRILRPDGAPSPTPTPRPTLIVTGDRWDDWGQQIGQELWRVSFLGWGELHELRAEAKCVPRRFVVIDADGLVRASGYTRTPTCLTGEPFTLRVPAALPA